MMESSLDSAQREEINTSGSAYELLERQMADWIEQDLFPIWGAPEDLYTVRPGTVSSTKWNLLGRVFWR